MMLALPLDMMARELPQHMAIEAEHLVLGDAADTDLSVWPVFYR